ncbi:MAG TPA: hypothetical protein VLQ45_16970 [Thermoanaerobaculia bacterium]|nr:hypothetical protein [Thermoanaerobaculia bacterium]
MPRETKYVGIVGDLQRLLGALEANREELPQLEPFRQKLAGILAQVLEVLQQQATLKATKQESSKRLQRLLGEGQRLGNVVRTAVKEHYGVREEKVVEFGLQPFRGRKVKAVTEKPVPTPSPPPASPETPAGFRS